MKKRIFMILLAVGIVVSGCGKVDSADKPEVEVTEPVETVEEVIYEETEEFSFSELQDVWFHFESGAGGWRTEMRIKEDGSFSGSYSDFNMGEFEEEYPRGTCYKCNFAGIFSEPVKVNGYTYSMKIKEISYANEPDTKEIVDEQLHCYTTPYGLDGAEDILIYLPGAPIADLPEEYINWVRTWMEEPETQNLPFYGLYNVKEQNGFFGVDISVNIDEMMAIVEEWAITIRASLEHDDLNQAEMNEFAKELYDTWDHALNTLWKELKETLPEDEFAKLLEEQRAWITEKERAVEEAGKEYEGGSIYPLIVNMKAAEITEERVYELYEMWE